MKTFLIAVISLLAGNARAQMAMTAQTLIEAQQNHGSSGTSVEPASTPVPMLMTEKGAWRLMLHANASVVDNQQQAKSEHGRDAFYSPNWIMPMAQRGFGEHGRGGLLTLRTMLSFEPATVGRQNFPELFQQGETAHGAPIVDGQHPHDFFMEVAALYDLPLGKNALFSLYAAPIGDPAIGPTAYPHRHTASENPLAALGHHQEDSTHIAFNVVTGGLTYKWARVELSGFHGAEPTEARWHFQPSPNGLAMDSVATRVTVSPGRDWTAQYSIAHIEAPEQLYPKEAQQRQTASAMYHHTFKSQPMGKTMDAMPGMEGMDMSGGMGGMSMGSTSPSKRDKLPQMQMTAPPVNDLAITLLWGRTLSLADGGKENSYLAEVLYKFAGKNNVWTRMENAGRSNELLLTPGAALPKGFAEEPLAHVAAYSFGYDRDFALGTHLLMAPGVQFTLHRTPPVLRPLYGATPTGETVFVRFRLR